MRVYSIGEAARLIGVSTATVSRHLAPDRALRGRSAKLSIEEVAEIAQGIQVDPDAVRRRAAAIDLSKDMPPQAAKWATAALERGLETALSTHNARIPRNVLAMSSTEDELAELLEPWGAEGDWVPVTSDVEIDALLPPLDR